MECSDGHRAQRKGGLLRAGEAKEDFKEKVLVHQGWEDSQAGSCWTHLSIVTGSGRHVGLSGTLGR